MNVRGNTIYLNSDHNAHVEKADSSALDFIKLSLDSGSVERHCQASCICFSIVDKHAPKAHEEIKALLKLLEFELSSRSLNLDENSDSRNSSLLRQSPPNQIESLNDNSRKNTSLYFFD